MTGPERYVVKAIAALELANPITRRVDGGPQVSAVAELSKYPDLEDRRIVRALVRKGYAHTFDDTMDYVPIKRVKLTAQGWMEALNT
jgi:hypothetical protein